MCKNVWYPYPQELPDLCQLYLVQYRDGDVQRLTVARYETGTKFGIWLDRDVVAFMRLPEMYEPEVQE